MTPVTRSGTILVAAALGAGLLAAVPALADAPADPVSGLVGGLLGQPDDERTHHRDREDYGRTSARDGVLRQGCRDYRYRYVVTAPTDDWTIETFLDDRTGETIASGTFISDFDPNPNRPFFRFCRYSTKPGRFTIRAKVHWYNGSEDHKVWLMPSRFRLRRAG
jgi:hypothetical protein